jgi:hypothetical protein
MLSKWKKYHTPWGWRWPPRTLVVAFIGGAILFLAVCAILELTDRDAEMLLGGAAGAFGLVMWNKHRQEQKERERQVEKQIQEWDAEKAAKAEWERGADFHEKLLGTKQPPYEP